MTRWFWIVLPGVLLTAGCHKQAEAPQQKTFHEIMKDEVDTRADDVWAIGNEHIDANAGIDAASMSDADWTKLASAAVNLQQAALAIANLKDPIVVVKPGVKIADEGVPGGDSAESVKANIAKDPQGLFALQAGYAQPAAEKALAYGRTVYDIVSATQSEFTRAAEAHFEQQQRAVQSLVEAAAKNAPAGSESAVAAIKSVFNATNTAYETVNKAAKQAVELAESNFQAASKVATKVSAQAGRAAKQAA